MGNVNMEATQIHDRTEAGKHQSIADHLKALDAVAQQIENLPTFTSNDRAFLEELPAFPSEDGKKVLTATTESGATSLSYDEIPNELPADPATDGTKVLTATTTSGETVLSWEDPASGGLNYSTTEQDTGLKWINNKNIYVRTIDLGEEKILASNAWYDSGVSVGSDFIINGFANSNSGCIPVQLVEGNTTEGIKILQTRNTTVGCRYVTAYYTKTTT